MSSTLQTTTIATLASQTSFTLSAGSSDDDAYNSCLLICTDQSTAEQKCFGYVLDYTGSSKTVTLKADPGIFTMETGDGVEIIAPLAANITLFNGFAPTTTTIPTVTQIRQEMDSNSIQLAAIVEDTSTTIPAQIAALDFSTLDAAQIRAAIGMAAADLDSQLSSLGASTDTLYTYTFNAPQNTRVFVYSDSERNVLVRNGTTDATGSVTFDLPAATFYYLAINQYGQELRGTFTVVAS